MGWPNNYAEYAYDINGNVVGLSNGAGGVLPLSLQYKSGGTPTYPVSSFDGASVSGAFGLPESMLIPANYLSNGSRIRISMHLGKTGAGTAFIQVHLGSLNSISDANMLESNSPQYTVLNPSKWILKVDISFGDGSANAVWDRSSLNVGVGAGFPAEKTGINFAVNNYINFVVTGAAAASTYTLIEYHVEVFP